MQASDEESHKSFQIIDGDFNPLDDGQIDGDEVERTQNATLDNSLNHKRLISNIDTQTIKTTDNLKDKQFRNSPQERTRNGETDIIKQNKSTAFTYNSSMNKLKHSTGDGGVFRQNRNYLSDIMAGSQSFASGQNDNSPNISGNVEKNLYFNFNKKGANPVSESLTPSQYLNQTAKPRTAQEFSSMRTLENQTRYDKGQRLVRNGRSFVKKEKGLTESHVVPTTNYASKSSYHTSQK